MTRSHGMAKESPDVSTDKLALDLDEDDWLLAGTDTVVKYYGSHSAFDIDVDMYAQLHLDEKAIVTARFHVRKAKVPRQPTRYFRCFLRLEGHTDSDITTVVFKEQSCLISNPYRGQLFSISFPNTRFDKIDGISIDLAIFRMEPIQVASLAPTMPLGLSSLATFNDPDLSDCSIVPKDGTEPVHVSRAILARASPFFATMFKGNWAESVKSETPIPFGWHAWAFLPCLIHMYSGWVIGTPLPDHGNRRTVPLEADAADCVGSETPPKSGVDQLLGRYHVDLGSLTVHQLLELMNLARLLELPLLVAATNREMVRVLDVQYQEVQEELKQMQVF